MKFSDQIYDMSRTGNLSDKNIHALLRPVFKKWDNYLRGTEISCKSRCYQHG